jgi:hypothetical protein
MLLMPARLNTPANQCASGIVKMKKTVPIVSAAISMGAWGACNAFKKLEADGKPAQLHGIRTLKQAAVTPLELAAHLLAAQLSLSDSQETGPTCHRLKQIAVPSKLFDYQWHCQWI